MKIKKLIKGDRFEWAVPRETTDKLGAPLAELSGIRWGRMGDAVEEAGAIPWLSDASRSR